ncbi:hypothetical protein K0M31_008263 [Melipona bicolor]|uniref:Uncharacterized protein n=1 Tax=Melipona bicolor TaxID=60889 RepID=A0AA40KKD4_9HYME|nr:hypothetical protein K0M31_008263 [Melipona bicolor]
MFTGDNEPVLRKLPLPLNASSIRVDALVRPFCNVPPLWDVACYKLTFDDFLHVSSPLSHGGNTTGQGVSPLEDSEEMERAAKKYDTLRGEDESCSTSRGKKEKDKEHNKMADRTLVLAFRRFDCTHRIYPTNTSRTSERDLTENSIIESGISDFTKRRIIKQD